MGLAEPKRRTKLSHDPRNLSWSQSSSFGQRLMVKHGWKEGQSLGNRESTHVGLDDTERLAAARVGVLFKDNNLGLGAKTKSKDIEAQRTGLDAFQGLLGRLNGKSDVELKAQETKIEERKLEMYMRGRWGGMVFVRGGILVGDLKEKKEAEEKEDPTESENESSTPAGQEETSQDSATETMDEKQRRKQERRQRKEERQRRRERKALRRAAKQAKRSATTTDVDADDNETSGLNTPATSQSSLPKRKSPTSHPPDEPISSASSSSSSPEPESQPKSTKTTSSSPSVRAQAARGGRHLLRGRNIQAKRMAFADMKGLNEIFMR